MFKIHDFVMSTLCGMRDHYPEFQVRQFALSWYSRGAIGEEDLMEIESWYAPAVPEYMVEQENVIDNVPQFPEEG